MTEHKSKLEQLKQTAEEVIAVEKELEHHKQVLGRMAFHRYVTEGYPVTRGDGVQITVGGGYGKLKAALEFVKEWGREADISPDIRARFDKLLADAEERERTRPARIDAAAREFQPLVDMLAELSKDVAWSDFVNFAMAGDKADAHKLRFGEYVLHAMGKAGARWYSDLTPALDRLGRMCTERGVTSDVASWAREAIASITREEPVLFRPPVEVRRDTWQYLSMADDGNTNSKYDTFAFHTSPEQHRISVGQIRQHIEAYLEPQKRKKARIEEAERLQSTMNALAKSLGGDILGRFKEMPADIKANMTAEELEAVAKYQGKLRGADSD